MLNTPRTRILFVFSVCAVFFYIPLYIHIKYFADYSGVSGQDRFTLLILQIALLVGLSFLVALFVEFYRYYKDHYEEHDGALAAFLDMEKWIPGSFDEESFTRADLL